MEELRTEDYCEWKNRTGDCGVFKVIERYVCEKPGITETILTFRL